jgi:hypothetical protein
MNTTPTFTIDLSISNQQCRQASLSNLFILNISRMVIEL